MIDAETDHEAPRLYPTTRCRDAEAMIRWLKETLGFRERVVYRRDGVVEHAELSCDGSILMLGQMREDDYARLVGPADGRRTDALYLAVDDVDAAHARVAASGCAIVTPPRDTGYGSREFAFRDPEGGLWSCGTYRPRVGEKPLPG